MQAMKRPVDNALSPAERNPVLSWAVKTGLAVVTLSAALLIPAGTLRWGMAWAYIVLLLAGQGATGLVLLTRNQGLFEERTRLHAGYKKWDLPLAAFLAWSPLLLLTVAGLEFRRSAPGSSWTPVGLGGLLLTATGYGLTIWAMSVNRFFSSVVRIQTDRGHSVVASGPYRFVRHPGYAGFIAYAVGTALALGSVNALIPAAAIVLVIVLRTFLEDRVLQRELDGYLQYSACVRRRLLPGIW